MYTTLGKFNLYADIDWVCNEYNQYNQYSELLQIGPTL